MMPIGDKVRVGQDGDALAGDRLGQQVEEAEVRRVEPGEDQADDDLADHEGKEEQRLVQPDAGDGLVQEDRDEKPDGQRQHVQRPAS